MRGSLRFRVAGTILQEIDAVRCDGTGTSPAGSKESSGDSMTAFPQTLARSSGGPRHLQLAKDLLARRGDCAPQDTTRRIATIEGDAGVRFTLLRGQPGASDIGVYREPGAPGVAIPTGRVFLRFADGMSARGKDAAIGAAGYRIAALLDYAENAAWVEAMDDDVAAALTGLDRLAAIPDVVNVEPQLLSPRALK
jgi:hypothetical protein